VSSKKGESKKEDNVKIFKPLIVKPFYSSESTDSAENINNNTVHTSLQFDSVFESGNLAIAMKVSDNEYDLILQNDINTKGHT
jgi:hypothetical protein